MRQGPWLLPLLLVAGCAAQPAPQEDAQALQDALAVHRASMAGIGARPVSAPAEGGAPVPAPAPQRAAGTMPSMAGQLVGQTPDRVLAWLGPPRLRREEGSAEIWHYQASQCHLDLVLYRDEGPAPVLRVAYASARAAGAARRGETACLRDIARAAGRGVPAEQARAGG